MSRTSKNHDPELSHRLSRRGMLGVAAGASAAALLGAAVPASAAPVTAAQDRGHGRGGPVLPSGRLGIQLYSLRDRVSTLGFAPVFAELAKYGYDEVEFAGYTQGSAGPITLAQLKRLARDHGLNPIGSHVNYYDDNNPGAYTSRRTWRRCSTTPRPSDSSTSAPRPAPGATARPSTAGSAPPRTSTPTALPREGAA